ncbi:MAG: response regulator transcription factor [Lachnospiraceae bacterium]|nr:response regulator transcription factor [Lachnospiraceae bacterium]
MSEILIVEDQKDLARLLGMFIRKAGFTADCVSTGEEALSYLQNSSPKLMLLDVNLPGMDGFAVCRRVRKQGSLPILMLSARIEKEDQLSGFLLGADDYIEKPVDLDILIAKIKAVLQRIYGEADEASIIEAGDLTVDTAAHKVYKNGNLLNLNVKEYELLVLLVKNRGKVLHKDYLFNEIWGADSFSENQTLTVHIKRLRDKIEDYPKEPEHIKTIWGVGYCYEEV